jgi:hypothetical protein
MLQRSSELNFFLLVSPSIAHKPENLIIIIPENPKVYPKEPEEEKR